MGFIEFLFTRHQMILRLLLEHIWFVLFAIIIAIFVGVFLGLISAYYPAMAKIILPFTQITMTVPSIALMGILIPLVGIGMINAIICLVVYSLLSIVRNTYTGIKEIPEEYIEAARGMGMTKRWILFKIKIPLALPVIIAGIRTSIVMIIGIGAIMSYIGVGGLGDLIFRGIARTRQDMILTGAVFVSILSIVTDYFFGKLESYYVKKTS